MTERTLANWTAAALAAAVVGLGAVVVLAPLPILLDRFIPDDAFYYFETAKNFAATGESTFDGFHFTNGYHPLWFLLSVPMFLVFPGGGETPFRLLLALQLLLAAAGSALMAHVVAKRFGAHAALLSALPWLVVCQPTTVNGLETGLLTLAFAATVAVFLRYLECDPVDVSSAAFRLGVAASLLFLARTDAIFLIGAIALHVLTRGGVPRIQTFMAFVLPVALLAGGYVAINLAATGHAMPVSGAAKVYHSAVARDAAVAAGTTTRDVWIQNLLWPLAVGATWMIAALALAAAALVWSAGVAVRGTRHPLSELVGRTWPLALASLASFVFYATAFYGGFTQTSWYYGPAMMTAWFYLAAASALLAAYLAETTQADGLAGMIRWLLPAIAVSAALGWIGAWTGLIAGAAAFVSWALARRIGVGARAAAIALIVIGLVLLTGRVATEGGLPLYRWLEAGLLGVIAAAIATAARSAGLALAALLLGVALPTWAVQATNLVHARRSPAVGWGAHLLAGAEWARRRLPADATIWSASAGILGYFSDRRVVNTDGLANSYEFLDTVLRPRRFGPYIRRWDYAIDAFNDRSLEQFVPEGCFVPLPDGASPPPFDDGTGQRRQLAVFQMKPQGVVRCRPE